MSDGSIKPGIDSVSGKAIDIITSYQMAGNHDKDLKGVYPWSPVQAMKLRRNVYL